MFAEHSEASSKRGCLENITSLCAETNFNINYRDDEYAYKNMPNKLKFLFDIKNKEDMVNKINYFE